MKKILLFALCAITSLCLVACGSGEETTADNRETLVVGLECAYAPFNWTETKASDTNYPIDGTNSFAEGYDVQIAKKIADGLDRRLVIKALSWDGLIPAVQNGIIDLIIAGMSPTDARKVDIDFTESYYTSEHVVLVSADSQYASATSISDFSGATIIGQTGTLYDSIVKGWTGITVGTAKSTVPEIITDIQNGIIDGTVLEYPVAQGIVGANSDLKMIQFSEGNGFTQLFDTDANEIREIVESDRVVSIGLEKGNEELLNSINEILAGISADVRTQLMSDAVSRQAA